MEIITFGEYKWKKTKGSEGQDVYVALFLVEDKALLGRAAEPEDYDIVITEDTDFYLAPDANITQTPSERALDESQLAFRFRKNTFTPEEQSGAYNGLYLAAKESHNRGMAAGGRSEMSFTRDWVTTFQLDILNFYIGGSLNNLGGNPLQDIIDKHEGKQFKAGGTVWLTEKVKKEFDGEYKCFFDVFMERVSVLDINNASLYALFVKEKLISSTGYATPLWSGIAGFYGRYPRIPYGRPTLFTEDHMDGLIKSYPFARKLEQEFEYLMPERYAVQKSCADKIDKRFLIGEDTTFTTITVNTTTKDRNARMSYHRDAGSLNEGFSNLTVLSSENHGWSGGYLVTPQVRVAIDIRPGDLLLIDNMRIIHGNTPINPPVGGTEDDLMRMSLVYYFREDMLKLGSYEYEELRRAFVNSRMKDKDHPLQRTRWNGVSPDMWNSSEWYDYAIKNGGRDMMMTNQQDLLDIHEKTGSLEDYF